MIIWLVGLSGSGKSTIGQALYDALKPEHKHTIMLDGDKIRSVFQHDNQASDYSLAGRRKSAQRLQALCHWLDKEGMHVICCAISMFQDINELNRSLFTDYKEIFINVPIETLIERDNKGLYEKAINKQESNVVGIDIPYTPPNMPDLIISNTFEEQRLDEYVEKIRNVCRI
ncbi:adenylyl-sulfate kinase [Motilimonas cestriensis]|uniref:Adenylyl-sulfate kinase n=1 Tax=Motilimonas cestriensis TaxID=2742685 RepID=A0ABS8WE09_9GAMM|nr:adenylyl-sulfate kinase [Motilimonas cestriensis]MCE2595580.1 adenylyl-sulfate kinase [Motilimonas cestriensis]